VMTGIVSADPSCQPSPFDAIRRTRDDALLAGHSVDMICADLDVTPASLVRAYQRAGRTVPAPIRHRHNEILTGRSSL